MSDASFSPFSLGKTGWEGEEEGWCCMQSGGSNAQSFERRWASPWVHPIWSCTCVYVPFAEMLRGGRRVDVVYFSLSKAFNAVSHVILTAKLVSKLGKWTVRWVENWLDCQAQRAVISDTRSNWRPVISGVTPQAMGRPHPHTPALTPVAGTNFHAHTYRSHQ